MSHLTKQRKKRGTHKSYPSRLIHGYQSVNSKDGPVIPIKNILNGPDTELKRQVMHLFELIDSGVVSPS